MLFALAAPLLSAGGMMVSGVPVEVASSARFGHYYVLSVPAAAASPTVLQRVLLEAAAQRTLADGRHAFTTTGRAVGTGVEARLDEARLSIRTSSDRARLTLAVQELNEPFATQGEAIDAQEALRILGES